MRSRRRSLLTVGSAAVSLCLLGALMALYQAFFVTRQAPPQQALRVITRNRVSPSLPLPISHRDRIRKIPGVVEVMPFQFFGGVYKEPRNVFARYAVEPERVFLIRPDYVTPDDQKAAFRREKTACIVGRNLATRYQLKLGDRMVIKGDIFPVTLELTVRGIYDNPFDNDLLYFRLDYLFDLLPERRRNEVFLFQLLAREPGDVPRIARDIDNAFRNSTAQTKSDAERAFMLGFLSLLGNVKGFMVSVGAALAATLLLVMANTVAMAVRERVREVGILKTLGFTKPAIVGMILGESAFLAWLGGMIGCAFAYGLVSLVRGLPAFILPLSDLELGLGTSAVLVLTGTVIGIASALVPALRAAHTPILKALKFLD